MKDDLGLGNLQKQFRKLDKDMQESLKIDFDFLNDPTKIRYQHKKKPKSNQKRKPLMTRSEYETAKKVTKTTGSLLKKLIYQIKHRKEIKRQKDYEKVVALAHEVQFKLSREYSRQDCLLNIARQSDELEKLQKENDEREEQLNDPTNKDVGGCDNHHLKFDPSCAKCMEWLNS